MSEPGTEQIVVGIGETLLTDFGGPHHPYRMNSEAEKIVLRRQKEINEFGVDEKRRHALQTLKLKTVIKVWVKRGFLHHMPVAHTQEISTTKSGCTCRL